MVSSTTRFQSLLEAMPDALVGVDHAGVIRFLNRRTESLFGYDRGQLIGQRIDTLVPAAVRTGHTAHRASYAKAPVARLMGPGLALTGLRRDGTEFPVEVSLSSFQTKEGTLVTATVRDVSEQRKAFEAAQRLAAIIENSDDAIIGETLDGIITSWNPAAERMFGLSGQETIGQPVGLLSPQGRTGEIKVILARIIAGQPVDHFGTERVRKDGTVFPVSLAVSPIRDIAGVVIGASTICRDVTEQVQAEKALGEAGRQYRLLAENASDLVVLASPDRVITWVSSSVTRRLGWATQDLIGTRLVELMHPEDAAATAALRDAVYSGRKVSQPTEGSVLRIRTKSGQYRWMSGDVTPVMDESGVHVGVVSGLRDVEALVLAREAAQADRVALRATLDSLLDPHVRCEAVRDQTGQIVDFRYVDANPAACAYLEMDHGDLVGARMLDLLPGVTGAGLLAQYRHVVETGEPLVLDEVVYAREPPSGQQRHLDIRSTRVGDGLAQTWRDVTDRHTAARALAESEEQYRLLAENASDVVMRLSPDHVFEWVSGSVADVLGWQEPDLTGHQIDEFVFPEDLAPFRRVMAEAGPGSTARAEFRFRRSDDTYRWVACRTRARVAEDGAPVALVGSLVDVQHRKTAEAQDLTRLDELEQYHRLTIGRENKILELKKEIAHLKKYASANGGDPRPPPL